MWKVGTIDLKFPPSMTPKSAWSSLPVLWLLAINNRIETSVNKARESETNIRRLVRVGQVLPEINHFMNGFWSLLNRAKHQRSIKAPLQVVVDCQLLLQFLEKADSSIRESTAQTHAHMAFAATSVTKFCQAILPSTWPPIPRFKQSPWAHRKYHYSVDWYFGRTVAERWLYFEHDR